MSNASASSAGATPLSASAIVAPIVGSWSHILRIEGYSATKGLGNGRFISSEMFAAGGHSWCLCYYPDSLYRDPCDSISFSLDLYRDSFDDAKKVEATYTISLLDQEGNPVPSYSRTCRHTFNQNDHIFLDHFAELGQMEFQLIERSVELIERSELEKSVYLKDDAFSVRCDVTVVKEIVTKPIPVSEVCRGVMKQER